MLEAQAFRTAAYVVTAPMYDECDAWFARMRDYGCDHSGIVALA